MQENWKNFMDEMGLEDMDDPMEEPSNAEYETVPAAISQHYVPEIEIEL